MMKLFRKFFWVFIVMLQAVAGIGAGLLYLSSQNVGTAAGNLKFNDFPVGGMSFEEAKEAIALYYEDQIKNGALVIEIDGKASAIPYSEIDVSVDIRKTFENFKRAIPDNKLKQFFYNGKENVAAEPVFAYNSGKLLKGCEALLSSYEKLPVPERYDVKNGKLILIPQVPGRRVDYDRLELELKGKLFAQTPDPYRIDTRTSSIFVQINGDSRKEPFNILVSRAQIPMVGTGSKAKEFLEPLQGLIFENNQEISLKALIDFSKFAGDVEKDLLNRIATAFYQSALPIDGMKILNRKPSLRPVPFAEPGLMAVIEGEGADLLLRNETEKPLMILFELSQDKLLFYIASTGEIKTGTLMVEKKDQVPPPIITSVNKTLSANETRVVSEGVPGFKAYVSRIVDNKKVELYYDKYLPISKIVETGETPINTGTK